MLKNIIINVYVTMAWGHPTFVNSWTTYTDYELCLQNK